MAVYTYKAVGPGGATEKGTVQAASVREAMALLKGRNLYPTDVKLHQPMGLGLLANLTVMAAGGGSSKQLAGFCRQVATLLGATIPYDMALEMILQQTTDPRFKTVLSDVRGKVMEGAYLADAMAAYPRHFPPMMVSMSRAGEASGTLVDVMTRLADHFDSAARLRSRVTSALVYPLFMLVFGSLVVIFLLTYVIPKITQLLESFGAELPLPTRILIFISDLITNWWWLLMICAGVGGWWAWRFLQTEVGGLWRDKMELRVPLWGDLRRKILHQRFAQVLGTLLKSGVELKSALEVSTLVLENRVYLNAMGSVVPDVQNKGLPLSSALRRTSLFPDDYLQMLTVGEETATLDKMMENLSNRLEYEIRTTLDASVAMLEPVMILMMGVVILFIVVSVLLPMLELNQLVGQ
ncbi:MAG: type II secretion system F family protein [Deltaproteobacteria bacterium]|nr:type II secretion system F family protein [Deltaproteobacteria bacterium]